MQCLHKIVESIAGWLVSQQTTVKAQELIIRSFCKTLSGCSRPILAMTRQVISKLIVPAGEERSAEVNGQPEV